MKEVDEILRLARHIVALDTRDLSNAIDRYLASHERGVLVAIKRFQAAISDFDASEKMNKDLDVLRKSTLRAIGELEGHESWTAYLERVVKRMAEERVGKKFF